MISGTGFLDEALQYLYECWACGLKFLQVMQRESLEKFLAVVSQLYQDLSLVVCRPQSKQKVPFDESIDELDRTVVLELHSFRQHADSRLERIGQTPDG